MSLLVACSDDTSIEALDVPDADTTPDGSTTADSSTDRDTGTKADAAVVDDAGVEDASTEDADADAEDAGVDPGTTLDSYKGAVADTLCASVSRCCFDPVPPVGDPVEGGTYNPGACKDVAGKYGFAFTNLGLQWASSERVALDQGKATECLKKIKVLSCSLTGAELRVARTACFAAIKGTQQLGDTCTASIECATGYCRPSDADAGANAANGGVCTSLVAKGGDCGHAFETHNDDVDQLFAEEVCSTRNSGDTGRHCASYDFTSNSYVNRENPGWKCADSNVPNGGGCSATSWCATGICDSDTFTCQDPVELLAQDCATLIAK